MNLKSVLIAIGAVIAIVVTYWLVSPLFIEREVHESLSDITSAPLPVPAGPALVAQGSFVSLAGHSAEGTATLLKVGEKYYVRFEDDFKMTNGPDLFVHFGKGGAYAAEARLGALKGNVGGQNYEVPEGIDPTRYDEVWVWCRAFAVPFGKATLQ